MYYVIKKSRFSKFLGPSPQEFQIFFEIRALSAPQAKIFERKTMSYKEKPAADAAAILVKKFTVHPTCWARAQNGSKIFAGPDLPPPPLEHVIFVSTLSANSRLISFAGFESCVQQKYYVFCHLYCKQNTKPSI